MYSKMTPLFALVLFVNYDLLLAQCPLNWVSDRTNQDICYYAHTESATWLSAEMDCVRNGGHLVTASSGFVSSQLQNLGLSSFWLGGTNQYNGGYSWVDGSNSTYSNWAPGQPVSSTSSMCVSNQNGKWYSTNCNQNYPYVCKLDMTLPNSCAACDDGWVFSAVTGKCYTYVSSQNSFYTARSQCQQYQADLVSIHSHVENTFITDLNNMKQNMTGVLTGLVCSNSNCTWIDGTPFDYEVFFDQYATPFDGNQWCAVIVADGGSNTFDGCIQDQTWNTFSCSNLPDYNWPALCQKNPTFPTAIKAPKKNYQFENSGAIRPIAKNPKFHH